LLVFVLPAVVTLAVAGFAVYILYFFLHDTNLSTLRRGITTTETVEIPGSIARDALTFLLILAGVSLVPFAAPPNRWFAVIEETHFDWRPTILGLVMLPLYALIVAIAPVRDFFGTSVMRAGDYVAICAVAVIWVFALRYCWQTQIFEQFFGFRRE
jgi:hypothetical protein